MGYGQRGRPRADGDRYPSGKLKPAASAPSTSPEGGHRQPISGALWQRMLADAEKMFGDARFGTELTRLGAIGAIAASEVATGIRIAGIYGRFEYYNNLRRQAASPHYIREYISEGAGADTELVNFRAKEGRERDRSFDTEDREQRERDANAAFKGLQAALPMEFRAHVEALCVEDVHVGYQGLIRARCGLAIAKQYFSDSEKGAPKKDRKKNKLRAPRLDNLAPAGSTPQSNPLKEAFFAVQRRLSPHLGDTELEQAWGVLCALKARDDFRRDKLPGSADVSAS